MSAAVSDNAPVRGDPYTNQLMALIGTHVRQHVAGQVNVLEAKIAALKFEVESQNAEMATLRSALAAVGLQKEIDGQAAEMAAMRGEIAGLRHMLVSNAIETLATPVKDEIIAELRKEVPIYHGRWDADAGPYQKNALTTHSGALWICASGGTTSKPGTGEDWTLCAKSARNGRSAYELARAQGLPNTASEREWLNSLKATDPTTQQRAHSGTAEPRK